MAEAPENQERVREALRILPERAIDELGPEEDLRDWVVVRVNDEITIDLMTSACGVTYAQAKDGDIRIFDQSNEFYRCDG